MQGLSIKGREFYRQHIYTYLNNRGREKCG